MHRALRNAAFVAVPVTLSACIIIVDGDEGALASQFSDDTASTTLAANADLDPFSAIRASAGLSVTITQGDQYQISLDERARQHGAYRVEDGVLRVSCRRKESRFGNKNCTRVRGGGRGEVTVTAPDFDSIRASSGAVVTVGSDMVVDALRLDASSGASIDARRIEAANVDAEASSGASVRLTATSRLNGRASSGGSVRYRGDPAVEARQSSGGGVSRLR